MRLPGTARLTAYKAVFVTGEGEPSPEVARSVCFNRRYQEPHQSRRAVRSNGVWPDLNRCYRVRATAPEERDSNPRYAAS